jgi:hypothetical protein
MISAKRNVVCSSLSFIQGHFSEVICVGDVIYMSVLDKYIVLNSLQACTSSNML